MMLLLAMTVMHTHLLMLLVACLSVDRHASAADEKRVTQKDKLMKARPSFGGLHYCFGLFRFYLRLSKTAEIIKEPIVCYLRESGSAEGSVADTRDRKEWKSSTLHRRDLKTHRQKYCKKKKKQLVYMSGP